MSDPQAIFLVRFLVPAICGAVAAVYDVRAHRIPNAISAPLLVAGLVFRGGSGGWSGLGDAFAGFAVGFGIVFCMWLLSAAGGGDVKFTAAAGAWLGPYHLVLVFVMSAILVGLFAGLYLIARPLWRGLQPASTGMAHPAEHVSFRHWGVPYAVPLTVAIVLRLAWMWIIHHTN